jgi:NAD+ kinase
VEERLKELPELSSVEHFVSREDIVDSAELVIAFGGDGTMLSTGRLLAGTGIPLIGVNLGKLGFLAENSADEVEETLSDYLAGKSRVVERTLVEVEARNSGDSQGWPITALNDIVIDKRETRLMVNLDVSVDGDHLGTFSADGLIVATPTGSTAYSLAVGGPIVAPGADVLVIAPIAPHMLTARPVVVPDSAEISITPLPHTSAPESVHVIADGQTHQYVDLPNDILVRRHPGTVQLVKRSSRTYFDLLRAKLFWGRRPAIRDGDNGHSK